MSEHLDALELRLSNERARLASAKTAKERELREVWVRQIEAEIAREREYIPADLSDDDLLRELLS